MEAQYKMVHIDLSHYFAHVIVLSFMHKIVCNNVKVMCTIDMAIDIDIDCSVYRDVCSAL